MQNTQDTLVDERHQPQSRQGASPASLADAQCALYWSLVEKSTARRASYANRASVIVAAATLTVAAVSFFLTSMDSTYLPVQLWSVKLLVLCLITSICSTISGLLSIVSIESERRGDEFGQSARLADRSFVSAKATVSRFGPRDYVAFHSALELLSQNDLNRALTAQLFVGLHFEATRTRHLRRSARLLIIASLLLAAALAPAVYYPP